MDNRVAPPDRQRAMLVTAEGDGDFLPLGDRHYAFFAEEQPVLLVTFEDAAAMRKRAHNLPEHFALANRGAGRCRRS
jgi:hypothetical protein